MHHLQLQVETIAVGVDVMWRFWSICFSLWCCVLQIDENVQREIINHRSLRHPNIIRFKEVS